MLNSSPAAADHKMPRVVGLHCSARSRTVDQQVATDLPGALTRGDARIAVGTLA
jgi:hypothetical protein